MTGPAPAHAVIGAGFGDEGKGLATDALAARLRNEGRDVTVVRSNGGAQAGHGVERPGGVRHVFHHLGSGSLAGARTHLSRFFVAHPMVFFDELVAVAGLARQSPEITIDPRALVTTPFDVALNQVVEEARGGARHGSCGMGFGETIERAEQGYGLTAADLARGSRWIRGALDRMAAEWLPRRAATLGLATDRGLLRLLAENEAIRDRFARDAAAFRDAVPLRADAALGRADAVVFEGAQGLELDMDLGVMPHVTRSRTGLPNMVEIAREAGIPEIRPVYMTRAYRTRHGAGPLAGEGDLSDWFAIVDETNRPNDWQGVIRAAPLDPARLSHIIHADLDRVRGAGIAIDPGLGITCLDQVRDDAVPLASPDGVRTFSADDLANVIEGAAGIPVRLQSRGPCREAVEFPQLPGRSLPVSDGVPALS
ncbi:adenylosuccinate synthetase [Cereibacter sphaeroides]|uniref:adenylosuccinate synthetase n=1 Tax=Cereibacter sphaeroides TaxID=1063 RepID=UPI001F2F066B|nr:adenylosuccinate synthetase [Cereibacter sphaeroides]MCE6958795.1 adenylosuccinate synthetase [Cereibacter sphaeroides]MCE6973331.1 adenylosuccinate synthetase [Cereibacter sphaeroides]